MKIIRPIALLFLAVVPASSFGAPMLYTFSGVVTGYQDDAGIIGESYGLPGFVGHAVEYVYLVDFEAPGEVTDSEGNHVVLEDWSNATVAFDYFYVKGISGSLIAEKDGGYLAHQPGFISQADIQYGYNISYQSPPPDISGNMVSGSDDDNYSVSLSGLFAQDWSIGQLVDGQDLAYDSLGNSSLVYSELTLTSITPVPLPAAAWLFGSALLGLGAVRRSTS